LAQRELEAFLGQVAWADQGLLAETTATLLRHGVALERLRGELEAGGLKRMGVKLGPCKDIARALPPQQPPPRPTDPSPPSVPDSRDGAYEVASEFVPRGGTEIPVCAAWRDSDPSLCRVEGLRPPREGRAWGLAKAALLE
jgi:hypothetical protein